MTSDKLKKAKKKLRKQKKKESNPQEVVETPLPDSGEIDPSDYNMDRRGFLKLVALGIFGVSIAGHEPLPEKWAFMNLDYIRKFPKGIQYYDLIKNYPQVLAAVKLTNLDDEIEHVDKVDTPLVIKEIERRIEEGSLKAGDYKFNVSPFRVFTGLPINPIVRHSAEEYTKKAVEFLYDRLPNLPQLDINFRTVSQNPNLENLVSNNFFIGSSFVETILLKVYDKKYSDEEEKKVKPVFEGGRYIEELKPGHGRYSYHGPTKKMNYWNIFCKANPALLVSPFSEVIPLATPESGYIFGNHIFEETGSPDLKQSEFKKAVESFSEMCSYYLATELAKLEGVPSGVSWIQENTDDLPKRADKYKFVPNAIAWMRENSMEEGLKIWMDDPVRFMKDIGYVLPDPKQALHKRDKIVHFPEQYTEQRILIA